MKLKYAIIARWATYFTILLIELYERSLTSALLWIFFLFVLVTLFIFDYLRLMKIQTKKIDLIMTGTSFVLGISLSFLVPAGFFYYFILPWDVVFNFDEKKARRFLAGSSLIFFLTWTYHQSEFLQILTIEFWVEDFISFLFPFSGFIIAISLASYVNREIIERVAVQRLNQQIEKLTIEKERNRMAQEIHDSLGHSLTGLIMHLDLLEKIMEKDQEKAQKLVVKAQNLARQGMKEVRLAVKTLGKRDYQNSFKKALDRLCDNLQIENGLDIQLDLAPEVENFSPKLKSIFYKNIQEALTNSIKHGKSQKILIQIGLKNDLIFCEIIDDGKGCIELQKGNGLIGMEERLKSVSGQIYWSSNIGEGFTLRFELVREVEEYE